MTRLRKLMLVPLKRPATKASVRPCFLIKIMPAVSWASVVYASVVYASVVYASVGLQKNLIYLAAMYRALARFLAVTLLAGTLHAASEHVSLGWNELSGAILNKNVVVDLKDGSRVKAVVISVQPTGLAVNVPRKGEASIAREQIASLHLVKMRKRGRIIGTTTGAVIGLPMGLFAGFSIAFSGGLFGSSKNDGAAYAALIGIAAGATAAGYFIGRSMDRQEIFINILPD